MDKLPSETMLWICDYLRGGDISDLRTFSLVNKECRALAIQHLFRDIKISFFKDQLVENAQTVWKRLERVRCEVQEWAKVLARNSAHAHVRNIKFVQHGMLPRFYHQWPTYLELLEMSDDVLADPPELGRHGRLRDYSDYPLHESPLWITLAELIGSLPNLTLFHHMFTQPINERLLQAIENGNPRCRLHLEEFNFKHYPRPHSTIPPEKSLLHSSRLSGISVRSCGHLYAFERGPGRDFTHEAVISLLGGCNPALERIALFVPALVDEELPQIPQMGERTLEGFNFNPGFDASSRASLSSFEMGGLGTVWEGLLEACVEKFDMSKLRTLKLRIPADHYGLNWLSNTVQFPALTSLVLGIHNKMPRIGEDDFSIVFLKSLRPLKHLRLDFTLTDELFQTILHSHGQSLRRLCFIRERIRPFTAEECFFNISRVTDLVEHCPMLEELAMTTPRSLGDANEVKIYQQLGRLRRLQYLALDLCLRKIPGEPVCMSDDADYPGVIDLPDYDNFESDDHFPCIGGNFTIHGHRCTPRRGHVRLCLLNAALDEDLACSIFRTIENAKPRADDALTLERLELRPEGEAIAHQGHSPGTMTLTELTRSLGQWWLIRRDPRYGHRQEINAMSLREYGGVFDDRHDRINDCDPAVAPVFERLWPKVKGHGNTWRYEWKSLPLTPANRASTRVVKWCEQLVSGAEGDPFQ